MKKLIFLFAFLINSQAFAQQTIFNVPSVEVTKKDKNFLQHESQFRTKDPQQFWNATNYFARGIGHDTEIDITQFNLGTPASNNVSLGVGAKNILSLGKKNPYQPKIILGFMAPISLQGNGVGHWIYGAGNISIPQSGTRLTAGISSGTKQIFGESVTCFIGGFEQKITNDLSFISDWYSGDHTLGILATGFSYPLPQEFMFYGGYQIPNSKNVGKNSFLIEISKIF